MTTEQILEKAVKKILQISPSQVDSYLGCPRRWWWKSVIRMPEKENQQQFVDGNVIHAIAERYMLADDNGRVPTPPIGKAVDDISDALTWASGPLKGQRTGDPVELYPDGWDAPLRNPAKAGHIRKVVKAAIETGVLVRYPGRIVERGYKRGVIPGVRMSGRMDVEHPGGIDDHKSTKAKKWCSSEKELAEDPKMLCYGKEWLTRCREREEKMDPETAPDVENPEFVTLRLNYFSKDPDDPFTKAVEVDVESPVVEDWWEETLLPAAQEMLDLANSDLGEKDWTKVEGPRPKSGECKKYGGCDFAPVCSRMRAPAAHRRIIDRQNEKAPEPKPRTTTTTGEKKMSLFAKARKRTGGVPPTSATETLPPTKAAESGGVAVAEIDEASVEGRAPWANLGCRACEGSGISSKNEPCSACVTVATRKKQPGPSAFKVWNDKETGELCWGDKDSEGDKPEGKATRTAKPAENTTRKKATRSRKRAVPKDQHPEDPQLTEQELAELADLVEEAEPSPEEPVTEARAKSKKAVSKKRKKKAKSKKAAEDNVVERPEIVPGLVLFINAVYLKAPEGALCEDLHTILAEEGALMAEELSELPGKEVDSFYQINTWDRKDLMGRCIGDIARELENTTVVAIGSSQDFKMMVDLLRPYAEVVIGGML